MMSESTEKGTSKVKVGERSTFLAQSCGAVDERECSMIKHLILAETRRSNAPAWVGGRAGQNAQLSLMQGIASIP